ncbi:PriCT-2 domain-containing protein [Halococcus saccharolyticus]|uniref:Primase C-terminal 2 domain-containing protein n=1 Tax=Halococcus saccharolyticus DSM 5350 TaxID=1227455 RepID=M0MEU9_9EURY|nr:PriCT-2 domain-containing protein [Halococcus saccharolyticus]EMA44277.1 hypothetical protein C449_12143 [Halococcus saccharolyticus DSM 5350]
MSDFEVVPAELRERDQWLLWDADNDVPRRPHWRGDFKISWNDPDDWHSFEEAVEAADERDSWGIGYVFSSENDNYARGLYGGLDLDGCVEEDRRPKDWLPSLQPFFDADAYMEFSPSGGGVHIPLAGLEKPEWWTDEHFTDDEHEGVEVLDNKFCTFTGDRLRNSGDAVADTGPWVEEWLRQAHKSITDDDPLAEGHGTAEGGVEDAILEFDGGGRAFGGDWFDAETAADALDHIDPDVMYPTWRDVGFALRDEFPTATALRLFKDWSRAGSKWDTEAERQAERIVEDSAPGGGRTIATVVHLAKQGGWDASAAATGTQADGGVAAVVPENASAGDAAGPDLSVPGGYRGPLIVAGDGRIGVDHPGDPEDPDSEGFWEDVTNFYIEAREFLRDRDAGEVYADLTVYPADAGESYDVTVPMTAFNEVRSFKTEVVKDRTTTYTSGIERLNDLRKFVGEQDAPERIGVERFGLFGGGSDDDGDDHAEFVAPEGALGPDGWLDDPGHAYVDQAVGLETKWALDPDDGDEFDADAVADVLETLPHTRETDRLLPVLGWFYASGVRPLVHEWTGEFNLLNITGESESGKTATLGLLWRLFGMDDDPLAVGGETKFTMMRSMTATNAVPVWFDEYKPATTDPWRIDALHGLLRGVTRGGTVQRGNADKTTDDYTLSAPVIVSGEQRIQGAAEQRRCVMTTFSSRATDPGTDTARAYKRLTGEGYLDDTGEYVTADAPDPREHALAYYQWVAGLDGDDLRERWNAAAAGVAGMLVNAGFDDGLGEAARQGLQTVVFGLRLYRAFAGTVGADVDGLVDEDAIESAVRYSAAEFVGGGHKSHVDTLVEVAARAAQNGYLEAGEHYTVVRDETPECEVRVNMSAAFDPLTKFVKDYDVSADLLDGFGDYRARFREAAAADGGYITVFGQNSPPIGRALGVHAGRACDSLDGFEARAFDAEPVADRPSGDRDDDADGGGGGSGPSQADRLEIVTDAVADLCERDDGAEHARVGDVVNTAMDAGVDSSAAHAALDKLAEQGDVYQPLTGQYRLR